MCVVIRALCKNLISIKGNKAGIDKMVGGYMQV